MKKLVVTSAEPVVIGGVSAAGASLLTRLVVASSMVPELSDFTSQVPKRDKSRIRAKESMIPIAAILS